MTTVFFSIIYALVFVVGLPTNGMAIWVVLFRTKKNHPSLIYMANLALADLLFVIWLLLKISYHINGNHWVYEEPLCKCSVLFIACFGVQRSWAVAHPLSIQQKSNKVAIGISVVIWVFIWLSTTALYLYNQTVKLEDPKVTTCHDVIIIEDPEYPFGSTQLKFYYFIFMGLVVFVSCVVIPVAYILLLRKLGGNKENKIKKRHNVVLLIIIVLVMFLVCFIPSNIMLNSTYWYDISTLCLSSLNSCLDSFMYYFVSENFRNHMKNTLLCRSRRTVDRMRVVFSSTKTQKRASLQNTNCSFKKINK
uniref:Coagulation factor II (thrombin) receptor-like 1, tandem duplicate 2 n=1 Tax=Oryzias melastigma TaxID=30732 RepID=A0A3B3D2I6_ORYME